MTELPDMPAPIVVFDLDGTLIDTAPDLMDGLNHVLKQKTLAPVVYNDMTFLVGQGARAMIEKAFALREHPLDPAEVPELMDVFVEHYLAGMPGDSRPFPGVIDALERLKAEGFKLAVCTNKMERLTLPLLKGLKLDSYFDAIAGGDTFDVRKPDPGHILKTIERANGNAAKAVMVGDSVNDIRAAQNAGVPAIAVPFGYTDVPVSELSPTIIIDHFDELTPALVQKLIA